MNKKQRKDKKDYKRSAREIAGVKDCYIYPSIYFVRWNRWRARCREHNKALSRKKEVEDFSFTDEYWE